MNFYDFTLEELENYLIENGFKKYKCYVRPLEVENLETHFKQQQVELLMREYTSKLEGILQLYPLQWYNFYDFWQTDTPKTTI